QLGRLFQVTAGRRGGRRDQTRGQPDGDRVDPALENRDPRPARKDGGDEAAVKEQAGEDEGGGEDTDPDAQRRHRDVARVDEGGRGTRRGRARGGPPDR